MCSKSTPLSPAAAAAAAVQPPHRRSHWPPRQSALELVSLGRAHSPVAALAQNHVARRRADLARCGGSQPPAQPPQLVAEGAPPRRLHPQHPPPALQGDYP